MAGETRITALRRLMGANWSWQGRATRKTLYASIGLLYLLALLTLPVVLPLLVVSRGAAPGLAWLPDLPLLALSLAEGAFLLGALVRRLHDRGRASWWLLVFFGPHLACLGLLLLIPPSDQRLLSLGLIGAALVDAPFLAWGMAEIFLLPGNRGPNRFGDDPREAAAGAAPATALDAA